MSDTVDMWRDLKEHQKEQKAKRLQLWKDKMAAGFSRPLSIRALTEFHYRISVRQGYLDFWPTTGKWALFLADKGPNQKPLTGHAFDECGPTENTIYDNFYKRLESYA